MVTRQQYDRWFTYLQTQFDNHSIYIWGGQGQGYPTVNEKWIKKKEDGRHERNALKTYRKAVAAGYEKKLKAFDCSGLGMYFLQNLEKIFPGDKNANGMMGECDKISSGALKKGDFVFRTYKSGSKKGRAYHIGYVVDDKLNIIEAKGRAYGVVKEGFSSKYWNRCGRPKFFKFYIENDTGEAAHVDFDRVLKKGCRGADVLELQTLLNAAGADPLLETDGIFGPLTREGVMDFQLKAGIKVDGIANEKTTSLLERLNDDAEDGDEPTEFTRLLKIGVSGEDVKTLQKLLNDAGAQPQLEVNGEFDSATAEALIAFQANKGLVADGIVGKNTSAALNVVWRG